MEVISKTIEIAVDKLPPKSNFIENEIRNRGIEPIRWAIVDINDNTLTLSVSGYNLTF